MHKLQDELQKKSADEKGLNKTLKDLETLISQKNEEMNSEVSAHQTEVARLKDSCSKVQQQYGMFSFIREYRPFFIIAEKILLRYFYFA